MSDVRDPATDQVKPTPNDLPFAHDVLIEEIKKRRALGVEKYGTALQPCNGRDQKRDILDELLDAAVYIITLMLEEQEQGHQVILAPGFTSKDVGDDYLIVDPDGNTRGSIPKVAVLRTPGSAS